MQYNFLALDLDGTLTNSQKEITYATKIAIRKYQNAGGIIVLASGRPDYGILPIARVLELNDKGGYVMAYNGAKVIDCKAKETIYNSVISPVYFNPIINFANTYGVGIITYKDNYLIVNDENNKFIREEQRINKMNIHQVDNLFDSINFPVNKFLLVGEENHIKVVEENAKLEFQNSLSICRSAPFFLEITPKGVDKGKTLKWLIQRFDYNTDHLAACGDSYNDLTMLETAGYGIAMGNAQQCVKDVASIIVPTNDNDGVA